jgi:hypothetical protein
LQVAVVEDSPAVVVAVQVVTALLPELRVEELLPKTR